MIDKIKAIGETIMQDLVELSDFIYENPELGYEEHKACKAHVDLLKKYGFEVEENFMGIETAFKAVYDTGRKGPAIAVLSEYDALPGIGHGCGHNMLGATGTGAGISLSLLMQEESLPGLVAVFGTPAEETSGAKVAMTDQGAFDQFHIALEAHPGDRHTKSGVSLALEAIEFKFIGKTSHAAANPEKGINALDAALLTFNNINALRQHILSTSRIHGIIREGGKAANIVPDLAIAEFYVRSTSKTYLSELVEKVKNCARAGALATGAELEMRNFEASYDNLVTNATLSEVFTKNLIALGITGVNEARENFGSVDIGNISQVVPTIHPYFKICEEGIAAHTVAFRDATKTPFAYKAMMDTVAALTMTAHDVIKSPKLLEEIQAEFKNTRK